MNWIGPEFAECLACPRPNVLAALAAAHAEAGDFNEAVRMQQDVLTIPGVHPSDRALSEVQLNCIRRKSRTTWSEAPKQKSQPDGDPPICSVELLARLQLR
jgi:hypothetical protein